MAVFVSSINCILFANEEVQEKVKRKHPVSRT